MKLCTLVGSVSRLAGGLFQSVRRLSQELHGSKRAEVAILSLEDHFTEQDRISWHPLSPSVSDCLGPRTFGYSRNIGPEINRLRPDLIHVHGIWQYLSLASRQWHRKTGGPYVISPRGMLDPWALAQRKLKKSIAMALFERNHLQNSRCLHALCQDEVTAMRALGFTNPVCVIPNGVDIPGTGECRKPSQVPLRVLFLGRIHPKKGLGPALKAWKRFLVNSPREQSRWQLVIAGWDELDHERNLKQLASDLELTAVQVPAELLLTPNQALAFDDRGASEANILFIGPVHGDTKDRLLRSVDAFILPSFSEGLPMAVLEAWSYGLPVIMTPHCHLPMGFTTGAAMEIAPSEESISQMLCQLVEMSEAERAIMGNKGRVLVERQFAWPLIADQMADVYQWVLGGGSPPASVEVR